MGCKHRYHPRSFPCLPMQKVYLFYSELKENSLSVPTSVSAFIFGRCTANLPAKTLAKKSEHQILTYHIIPKLSVSN